MKKACLAFLLLTTLGASSLVALPMVSLSAVSGDSSGGLGGGAFNASTQFEGIFKTFCLESNVAMSLNTTYYYNWSNVVLNQNDPLSLGSALLMNNYALGLFGANYATWGGATGLQKAFWFLEDESGGVNNAFVAFASSTLGSLANAKADAANGAYGVAVMNVWSNTNGTGDKQSQVAYVGVPDSGSTLALLAMAFGSLAYVSRRRKN